MRKTVASPCSATAAMMPPAMIGPISRAVFTRNEFSAMALGRSAGSSSIWTMNDWRVGTSNPRTRPVKTLRARIGQISTQLATFSGRV